VIVRRIAALRPPSASNAAELLTITGSGQRDRRATYRWRVGLANSAESPLPVRTVARSLMEWIDKLGRVWVEGQVTQVNRRSGTCYLVLRDPVADMSLNVVCARTLLEAVVPPLSEGDRVVIHAKPEFYAGRGTLNLKASESARSASGSCSPGWSGSRR
jgi:hypothetical protein